MQPRVWQQTKHFKVGAAIGKEVATSAAVGAAVGTGISLARSGTSSSLSGYSKSTYVENNYFLSYIYKEFLDENLTEQMYGSLYYQKADDIANSNFQNLGPNLYNGSFGATPYKAKAFPGYYISNNSGNRSFDVASDMHIHQNPGEKYGQMADRPVSVAHDYFSVMGAGISGSIRPQRLETGSLAFSTRVSDKHFKYNQMPFLDDYKVNFRYENSISNVYEHHKGQASTGEHTLGYSLRGSDLSLMLNDNTLYSAGARTESEVNRPGLKNKRLAGGKHVDWFTNEEIGAAYPNSPMDAGKDGIVKLIEFNLPVPFTESSWGVIDYVPLDPDNSEAGYQPIYGPITGGTYRSQFRFNAPSRQGIGAFVVTAEDGTMYHYSLPVYNFQQFSKSSAKNRPRAYSTQKMGPYATTWLLTAVTGADFVDRAPIGTVGEEDWGYWVKLEYGKFSSKYKWRSPYAGFSYHHTDGSLQNPGYTEGYRETYYLNSIATRSHTALFIKDVRVDGRGHYSSVSTPNNNLEIDDQHPSSSLSLSEVILLNNADYKQLTTGMSPALSTNTSNNAATNNGLYLRNGDTFAGVFDKYDIPDNSAMRTYINNKALKRVVFNYTYELARGTFNSFAMTSGQNPPPITDVEANMANNSLNRQGKLTLKSFAIYGPQNTKLAPDYLFDYRFNPNYDQNKWDAWGMYNSQGTLAVGSHRAHAQDGTAWSLQKITTPLGGITEVALERDMYGSVSGTFLEDLVSTLGGNLRVSNITVTDETGNQFKTRYEYNNINLRVHSTGVISKEPDFARTVPKSQLEELFDYPATPVIYGKVTVWNGRLSYDMDYNDKTEYRFVTPDPSMITLGSDLQVTPPVINGALNSLLGIPLCVEIIAGQNNYVQVNTNRIGQIQSIKKYNRQGVVEQSTDFGYSSDAQSTNGRKQGIYSEGVLTSDLVKSQEASWVYTFFINHTSKKYLPSVLTSVTTTSNNLTTVTRNTGFDFYTGEVLEKEYENALGAKFRSVQVPAYTLGRYAGMGSKVDNPANKHMLTQTAASYVYKLDAAGNPVGTVAAAIQTWKNDWGTYRSYNGTAYVNEAVDPNQLVWRKHEAYAWNAPELNTDGTYKNFVGYNWLSATQHPHWLKLGEVVQYDHYSKTLMTQDVNSNFTGQKMGYQQSQVIVSASNARSTEIAYSGAEDKTAAGTGFHFGGEVSGGENQSADFKHTGLYSLKLGGGASGFQYRAAIGTEVESGRTYHASVWVHKNDFAAKNGKLYAEAAPVGGTATLIREISLADASAKQAGDWYLLDLYFDLPSSYNNQLLTLGCRNSGATAPVYFDDFRFHPIDAPITTYVYDPHTWQVNYVLDGDNIYTRYEYDASGRLTRTYQETLGSGKAEKLMRENSYYYARRTH